jgi:hypothetical protein
MTDRSDAAVRERRGQRFAEVVRDGAQHDGGRLGAAQTLEALPRFVDHQQRMNPDVAFGMPLRLLLAADEGVHLRPEPFDHADFTRE